MKIKFVHYEGNWLPNNPYNQVAYIMYGRQIVFTGVYNQQRASTINVAERIIAVIAEAEGINPRKYFFYDLQTMSSYAGFKPGDYIFNELRPRWGTSKLLPKTVTWIEGYCAEEVLRDFQQFIWGDTPVGIHRNLAVARGSIPPP